MAPSARGTEGLLDALTHADMVGLGGVEPPTSPLSGVRSNQLSYRPLLKGSCVGLAPFSVKERVGTN